MTLERRRNENTLKRTSRDEITKAINDAKAFKEY